MPRQLLLNQITLCADGSLGIQWLKQVTENGEILVLEPHRTVIDIDQGDSNAQFDAVFAQLDALGYKTTNPQRNRMKRLVNDILTMGRADSEIAARRQAKLAERAAALGQ